MATERHKTVFYPDEKLLKKIDKFQREYGFSSRSKAVNWLLSWTFSKNPVPPPDRIDDEFDEYY